jgi:hypothetical protein
MGDASDIRENLKAKGLSGTYGGHRQVASIDVTLV